MATDLKDLRSAVELMAEQVNKLVALGSQQIEAIARLTSALIQSTEGLTGGLRQVVGAIQAISHPAHPVADQLSVIKAEAGPELTPLAHKTAHPALIYLTVLSIITSSTGRIISSGKKCLLILLGLATIKFDRAAREALLNPAGVEQTPPHPLF
jgi:hypothetical protein